VHQGDRGKPPPGYRDEYKKLLLDPRLK
jgi:hypothetical protein